QRRRLFAFPERAEQQHGTIRQLPRYEREETQREIVRPLEILEREEQRRAARELADERVDGLEQPDVALGGDRRRRRAAGELGEEPRELAVCRARSRAAFRDLRDHAAGAQRVDPRAERQDLLALVRAADEHARAVDGRGGGELFDETALADARLASEQHDVSTTAPRRAQPLAQLRELRVAADQGRVGG